MLHVDHDLEVIEQYPAALTLALAADQLRAGLAHAELDLVDDGPDLPVVGRRAQHECVGDHELLAHVVGDYAVGQLVRGRKRGGLHKLDGPRCGSHECYPASFGRFVVPTRVSQRSAIILWRTACASPCTALRLPAPG